MPPWRRLALAKVVDQVEALRRQLENGVEGSHDKGFMSESKRAQARTGEQRPKGIWCVSMGSAAAWYRYENLLKRRTKDRSS